MDTSSGGVGARVSGHISRQHVSGGRGASGTRRCASVSQSVAGPHPHHCPLHLLLVSALHPDACRPQVRAAVESLQAVDVPGVVQCRRQPGRADPLRQQRRRAAPPDVLHVPGLRQPRGGRR